MKKIKISFYIVAVLWIAAGTQLAVNRFFINDGRIIEAFADTESEMTESGLELVIDYGPRFLSRADKEGLIGHLADSIGLRHDYTLNENNSDKKSTLTAEKKGKNALTSIKAVTVNQKNSENQIEARQYILVHLTVYEKPESILKYRNMLEAAGKDLKPVQMQSFLKFTGRIPGKLTVDAAGRKADALFGSLQAKVVSENKSSDLYTAYAYTGLVKGSIEAGGKQFNLNLAVTYDEERDITNFCLATPVIMDEY